MPTLLVIRRWQQSRRGSSRFERAGVALINGGGVHSHFIPTVGGLYQ